MEITLAPLRRYLRDRYPTELRLSLGEIEEIIGARLPAVASAARWWTGAPAPGARTYRTVWTEIGYEAALSGFACVVRFRACEAGASPMSYRDRSEFNGPGSNTGGAQSQIWRRDGVVQRGSGKHTAPTSTSRRPPPHGKDG